MVKENWNMAVKMCDSCKTAPASLFCRADSAFLCTGCDLKIHAANKLASRHARVCMCDVCEQAPATVICKADAAALCIPCDRDIHTANPLARRHQRFPVVPFYDSGATAAKVNNYFPDLESGDGGDGGGGSEEEEAEAASWLLSNPPNPKLLDSPDHKLNQIPKVEDYVLSSEIDDPYYNFDLISGDQKAHQLVDYQQQRCSSETDGVVPAATNVVDGFPAVAAAAAYGIDYSGSKQPFMYNFSSQSISQSVSSSSMEVAVVPDPNFMADVSNPNSFGQNVETAPVPQPLSGIDREARVLRYRKKRKNRRFEKTIRYASRKAYTETRPRIKGRFAKRSAEITVHDVSYGVVLSY